MRFFRNKKESRAQEAIDPKTKIQHILENWKTHMPNFDYKSDSQGNYHLDFHAAPLNISVSESPGYVVCQVIPINMPLLIVKLPFDDTLSSILSSWHNKMVYSSLEFGVTVGSRLGKKEIFLKLTTKARLPEKLITPASLLHMIVEVSDGYWHLAKAFFNSGLLDSYTRNFLGETRSELFKRLLQTLQDAKTGHLKLQPTYFSSLLSKKTMPLLFHNMVGDESQDLQRQLEDYMKTHGLPAEFLVPGHIDKYWIASKYLKDFIVPVKKLLEKMHKNFHLKTIHQCFPSPSPPVPHKSGKVFLGIRYVVEVAGTRSFDCNELEEWKNSLLFSFSRLPMQYNITEESVELFVTLPFSILKQVNFVYPDFPLEHLAPDQEDLKKKVSAVTFNMKKNVDVWRNTLELVKSVKPSDFEDKHPRYHT